jgi:hypothetical protein
MRMFAGKRDQYVPFPIFPTPSHNPPSFLCSIAYIVFPAEQLFPGPIFPFYIRKEFQRLWLVRIQTSREGYLLILGLWGGLLLIYSSLHGKLVPLQQSSSSEIPLGLHLYPLRPTGGERVVFTFRTTPFL